MANVRSIGILSVVERGAMLFGFEKNTHQSQALVRLKECNARLFIGKGEGRLTAKIARADGTISSIFHQLRREGEE